MIHLDTSFLIRGLLRGTPEDRRLREWLTNGESLAMSCVAWAEFLCGPLRDGDLELADRLIGEPLELTAADAAMTAQLYELGGRRRGSFVDCMIAAAALRAGAVLATTNPKDFTRLHTAGLRLI
jgi:predicted nucleic acid-binding protein